MVDHVSFITLWTTFASLKWLQDSVDLLAWPVPMTSPTASDQLKALATTSSKRSKTARLKDLMPDIDHAMQSGVPRSEILQILSASGLEMTMSYFDVARRRIKKLPSASSRELDSKTVANSRNADVVSSIDHPHATSLNSLITSNPDTIKPLIPSIPPAQSARRFRDQFVDLDALSKLAPKKKP